jgi:peptide/nickel transport system permease protein
VPHALLRHTAVRLLGGAALLFVISVLTFLLVHLAPGDIVTNLLGNGPGAKNQAARDAIVARWRLDDSVWTQYWSWLERVLHGDWGTSIRQQRPVTAVLAGPTALSLQLVGLALLFSLAIGIPLGVLSAKRAGKRLDQVAGAIAVTGVSAPSFAVSLILIYVFGYRLHWFPLYGEGDGGLGRLNHLLLPALALSVGLAAFTVKITRSVMIRELGQDYITAARAHGWRESRALRLGLRNGAIPLVTSTGLVFSYLLASTILVEQAFALPGLGRTLFDAVTFKDIPLVQATTLLVAAFIITVSLIADVIAALLDPRTRRSTEAVL